MPATDGTPTTRSPWLRRLAVTAAAASVLALAPVAAGAQSFIDPDDPCPPGVEVPPAPVNDRDDIAEVHLLNVDCSFALDIAMGREDGGYDPTDSTRRDQMASFIVRSLEAAGYQLPAPSDQGFGDIDGNDHEDAINQLAQIGVALGVTEEEYRPDQPVRRDQMASFIVRAAEFAYEDSGLEAQGGPYFDDVDDGNVHRDNIDAGFEIVGLVQGVTGDEYHPEAPTRRDQMATFLVRLVDMTLIVE